MWATLIKALKSDLLPRMSIKSRRQNMTKTGKTSLIYKGLSRFSFSMSSCGDVYQKYHSVFLFARLSQQNYVISGRKTQFDINVFKASKPNQGRHSDDLSSEKNERAAERLLVIYRCWGPFHVILGTFERVNGGRRWFYALKPEKQQKVMKTTCGLETAK